MVAVSLAVVVVKVVVAMVVGGRGARGGAVGDKAEDKEVSVRSTTKRKREIVEG